MLDHTPPVPPDERSALSQSARKRRDAMLPELLAEVRRVRRRHAVARVGSFAGVFALLSGVLVFALLPTTPSTPKQRHARAASTNSTDGTLAAPPAEPGVPRIEIVQTSPDILDRLSIRSPTLVRVEYINTGQALSLLQSNGDRYGIIEIAGRVEFQLIAQR